MDHQYSSSVVYEEEYILNSRGVKLFTCRWLPANKNIKALVFLCHGYGVECSLFMKGTGYRLAQAGFAVFGLDYEGHGKSDGIRCHIKDFCNLVDDCANFFKSIREKEEFKDKVGFLLGESMGGVVALRVHRKQPNDWNGAVLVAPMCKISDEMKPPPLVVNILTKLASIFPLWRIVPTRDIIETGFKDPVKRQELRSNPYSFQGKPRLKTALELLNASNDMEQRLDEVTFPFLVVHGEADDVTDPNISKLLHKNASSFDKTLITYPGMWHGLLFGEPEDNIDLVTRDIINWLSKRSFGIGNGSPPLLTHSELSLVEHGLDKVETKASLKENTTKTM